MCIIEFVSETGSTNADLATRLKQGEEVAEGFWLIANRQKAGKGRQGRSWLDAPGNFMGSTVVNLRADDPPVTQLSLVASLALLETVMASVAMPAWLQLKWPNDVLLDGAKFCGILLERVGNDAVVGIGVNLAGAPSVDGRTIKSLSALGPAPDRDTFALKLSRCFRRELMFWREEAGIQTVRRWLSAAHPIGTPLNVHDESGTRIAGRFDGLDDSGALRLRLEDGAIRVIHAGDVSLEDR